MFLKPTSLQRIYSLLDQEQWSNVSHDLHQSLECKPRHKPFRRSAESLLKIETGDNGSISSTVRHDILGVIVESRQHPNLVPVIREVLTQLDIPIQVFHGPSSKYNLEEAFSQEIKCGQVILSALSQDHLPPCDYNTLLLSLTFWECLATRKRVFIFQCDAALCPNSKYTLGTFSSFDYIGSWWPANRPVGVYTEGGNGGLSIRDWHAHRQCLSIFHARSWPGAEDSFFAFYLSVMGRKVASEEDTMRFGTQHKYTENSFGAHKIGCLPVEELNDFLTYAPSARRILDNP